MSSATPAALVSAMSTMTTSASSFCAIARATVAPTLPAPPTTVTFRFMAVFLLRVTVVTIVTQWSLPEPQCRPAAETVRSLRLARSRAFHSFCGKPCGKHRVTMRVTPTFSRKRATVALIAACVDALGSGDSGSAQVWNHTPDENHRRRRPARLPLSTCSAPKAGTLTRAAAGRPPNSPPISPTPTRSSCAAPRK